MKLILDFFPILLFFGAFKLYDIYVATGVLMAATVVQMAIIWFTTRRLETMQKATLVLILLFGSLTLALHDDRFIKWKPTVLYGAFCAVLLAGKLVWNRDLLAYVLKDLTLPPAVWTRVTFAWAAFFAAMGVLNWYVAFHFSTDTWVNFKVWGGIGLFLLFALAQGLFLARYMTEPSKS